MDFHADSLGIALTAPLHLQNCLNYTHLRRDVNLKMYKWGNAFLRSVIHSRFTTDREKHEANSLEV
jgi:hypothetical protein